MALIENIITGGISLVGIFVICWIWKSRNMFTSGYLKTLSTGFVYTMLTGVVYSLIIFFEEIGLFVGISGRITGKTMVFGFFLLMAYNAYILNKMAGLYGFKHLEKKKIVKKKKK